MNIKNNTEIAFEWWILELEKAGIILEHEFEPKSFVLEDPVPIYYEHKYKTKDPLIKSFTLYRPITYTPDWRIVFDITLLNKFFGIIFTDKKGLLGDPNLKTGNVYQNTSYYATEVGLEFENGNSNKIKSVELWFDVKPPSHALKFSGKLGSSRDFKFNKRMMFNRHNIIVNKIIPIGNASCLFNKTFMPDRYKYTDGGSMVRKTPKWLRNPKNLKQYLNSI